ncbi:NH(3)-dependent NAD(+) synthetase [Spiroplasma clarkii]|uniref:NH(3)-dependent NAD(+) synthetase n=2 Tax=Spiroplasma clarkii TaxID=2139 RepID=A0A1Y0L1U7_9MOLU|nr:NAD(+) synthase [Spiroplasma clarkii]ARU91971.1 NH(3)-dependent NAD(+) synthetase [Spiroplasma clarkii]ATX71311.1 NH(3)-dependent NAD(+) synthetase [Spiroplasma clarkii]
MSLAKYLDYLVEWLQVEVKKSGQTGVIVGVSGGIDSAVVAALAKKAFPNSYLTVWMPCESSDLDNTCKEQLVEQLQLKNLVVDLKAPFAAMVATLKASGSKLTQLALANTKARLRMTSLYALAQSNNALVLGTDNADEWHIGYFTKFGDGGVDLLPLVHLLKSQVREAAKLLNVPEIIINRAPTAGLWSDQTDESEIGFSYDLIDDYLSGKAVAVDVKVRIEHLHKISEHKRTSAPMPKKYQS